MQRYRVLNTVLGWLVFIVAAYVYISTAEPTASFWDCGEFIATSYKLQVGHPPGAPTFQLLGRFFTMFAFGDVTRVAFMMNMMSALASAFTILFLFWTITILAKRIIAADKDPDETTLYERLSIFGAGLIGALGYTFTDTFWFSAVEAEVYALSSMVTAITFWAILKWDEQSENQNSWRWLLLIMYLVGLSIGIHLLNLLVLPAIVYIIYFRKYRFTWKGFLFAGVLSVFLLFLILYVIIPGVVILAGNIEIFFVNTLRLPFNSGTIFYLLALSALLIWGIVYTQKKQNFYLNLTINGFILLLIGYSTYFILVIRSNAEPPIDENNPSNAVNLLAYLQREQYGDVPLIYGPYYSAPLDRSRPWGNRRPIYTKDEKSRKYVIIDDRKGTKPKFASEFCTIFPRMFSNTDPNHVEGYERWGKVKGKMIRYNDGFQTRMIKKPTFIENLRFFFRYQVGHMYFRYFMWNFAGRQNDNQGHGNVIDGNWISGIPFIDNRLGPMDKYPEILKKNPAYNRYYMLPLIIGLIGLYFHVLRRKKDAFVVGLLFFMTGLAIIIYLNQTPYQPRERDYAYAASFYAYAIWIGLGVLAIAEFLRKYLHPNVSILSAFVLSFFAVPFLLAKENWDDHNRSGRYTARDIAKNYLDSCEPNAILFTNGDNDTFPLWYVQEVEGYRTDVRVVNLSLLNTDWYINSLKKKAYDGLPVPFSLKEHQYQSGTYDVLYLLEQDTDMYVSLNEIFYLVHNQPQRLKLFHENRPIDFLPSRKFRLDVDKEQVLKTGTVRPEDSSLIVDQIRWDLGKNFLYKNGFMVLDLLAHFNWERPIYFAITTGDDAYYGLQEYFQLEGLAYRLVPIRTTSRVRGIHGRVNLEKMYDLYMHKYQWGNMEKPGVYLDETNRRMCMNFRNNFARLAEALLENGDTVKAVEVLDKAMYLMPEEKVPYNYFVIPIAQAYYRAGQIAKGDTIIQRILDIQKEMLDYFAAFKPSMKPLVKNEQEYALAIVYYVYEALREHNRQQLMEMAQQLLLNYSGMQVGS